MTRFFISYNRADKAWAEWIAWHLEEAGYTAVIQAWDFRPGRRFGLAMNRAITETDKTIAVLSEHYLSADYTQSEWEAAFVDDPKGEQRKLIPVRVQECSPKGALRSVVYIDLVGLAPEVAKEALLKGLRDRTKPETAPTFPGSPVTQQPQPSAPPAFPSLPVVTPSAAKLWTVPYERNVFFTGREGVLAKLRSQLNNGKNAAIAQAISGLGGIGKTQTAVEYAYRHRNDYTAIFWVRAETRSETQTDFVDIARLLNLPEKDEPDPGDAVQAVKRWLENTTGWLLIFDNADKPEQLTDFRPRMGLAQGTTENCPQHILLTSRAQTFDSLGIAQPIGLKQLSRQEAVIFLLTRAGHTLNNENEKLAAASLAGALGYLPLALEQAGAYINAKSTDCAAYLKSYSRRKLSLLEKKGPVAGAYLKSVATTWSINFQAVEATSQAAADLLRMSAFLSPEAVPYELIETGASALGETLANELKDMQDDPIAFAEVLASLTRYSLVRAEPSIQAYSVARMVQEVQKSVLTAEESQLWIQRIIAALTLALTEAGYENWPKIERLLPHAKKTLEHIETYGIDSEAATAFLAHIGQYFYERGLYQNAESPYHKALVLDQKRLGNDHPNIAKRLDDLATVYSAQGCYGDAEPLFLQSLTLSQQSLNENHPDIATSLNNLALLYWKQGRYKSAEQLLRQAIEIDKSNPDQSDPDIAARLGSLAIVYSEQDKDDDAEALYIQAIELGKRTLNEDDPLLAMRLNNLGGFYAERGRYSEAEPLFMQAIEIGGESLGYEHPSVATWLNNLAYSCRGQGLYEYAEPLFLRAIELGKLSLGEQHPEVAIRLNNLAVMYKEQNRHDEAEPLFLEAIKIGERKLGNCHATLAVWLSDLADLYQDQCRYSEAERFYGQSLAIFQKSLGSNHSSYQRVTNKLHTLKEKQRQERPL